jgi:guanylate cyclase
MPPAPADLVVRFASIGSRPDDDTETRLRKSTLTLTATIIAVAATAWTLIYLALDRPASAAMPFTYQVATALSLIVLWRTKRDGVVRAVNIVLMLILPVLLQWTLGGFVYGSAVMIWAFAAPLGALVFISIPVAAAACAVFVGSVIVSGILDPWLAGRVEPLPDAVILAFFVLNIAGLSAIVFLALAYFVRERQRALQDLDGANQALTKEQAELRAEQARSASLLLNILPEAIAERLKGGDRRIADRYEAVTVLFVDIVDFTPLAARLSATDLVLWLGRIFEAFEQLCERHGLEKIKTAGDSFMAVAGLPEPRDAEEGAVAAAEMGLAVMPAVERISTELQTNHPAVAALRARVGIHTGPVVAGVIGQRKFAYDLWGDAVNVASRMESQGLPGQVQVSLSTFEYLQPHFRVRYRGTIEVKGRGEMGAYLVQGRRQPHAPARRTPD